MHAFSARDCRRTVLGDFAPVFRQATPGFTIDRFNELFDPAPPAHIKLDVDGLESAILGGGRDMLMHHTETVLVEIDGDAGPGIRQVLTSLGFTEDTEFAAAGTRGRNALFRRYATEGHEHDLSDPSDPLDHGRRQAIRRPDLADRPARRLSTTACRGSMRPTSRRIPAP